MRPDHASFYIYTNWAAISTQHMWNQSRVCLLPCTASSLIVYSVSSISVHQWWGEQVSGTFTFIVLHRLKAAIRFLGRTLCDCLLCVHHDSSSSSLECCAPSSTPGTASSSCCIAKCPEPSVRIHHVLHIRSVHVLFFTAGKYITRFLNKVKRAEQSLIHTENKTKALKSNTKNRNVQKLDITDSRLQSNKGWHEPH